MARDLAQRYRGAVDLGHEQPAQDHLVEAAVGTARKEAVQLHKKLDVHIVALRSLRFTRVSLALGLSA